MAKSQAPSSQFARYIGPVIQAIRGLGGSGRPDEVRAVIARDLRMSDSEQSEPLPSGVQTRFENQVHWARFYLAKAGYIDSSQRGVWTLTEKGRSLGAVTAVEIQQIIHEVSAQKPPGGTDPAAAAENDKIVPTVGNYREELAQTLQGLPAPGFERFCQRLLRESGFQEVTVTGRSGDGGIDGIGILQVNALVSFKVLFQCKKVRWLGDAESCSRLSRCHDRSGRQGNHHHDRLLHIRGSQKGSTEMEHRQSSWSTARSSRTCSRGLNSACGLDKRLSSTQRSLPSTRNERSNGLTP